MSTNVSSSWSCFQELNKRKKDYRGKSGKRSQPSSADPGDFAFKRFVFPLSIGCIELNVFSIWIRFKSGLKELVDRQLLDRWTWQPSPCSPGSDSPVCLLTRAALSVRRSIAIDMAWKSSALRKMAFKKGVSCCQFGLWHTIHRARSSYLYLWFRTHLVRFFFFDGCQCA